MKGAEQSDLPIVATKSVSCGGVYDAWREREPDAANQHTIILRDDYQPKKGRARSGAPEFPSTRGRFWTRIIPRIAVLPEHFSQSTCPNCRQARLQERLAEIG